jgi:ATP-dependent DNA helicase RecG
LNPVLRQSPETSREASPLESPVQYARGVGPAVAEKLGRLGISSIEDLLYHFPRRYEDRSHIKPIAEACPGTFETVSGMLGRVYEKRIRPGLTVTKIPLFDGRDIIYMVWFNQPYIKNSLKPGIRLVASGKVERRFNELQINTPEFETIGDQEDRLNTGRIVPIYPLTERLSQKYLRRIIRGALERCSPFLAEDLPGELRRKYDLPGLPEALEQVHFPDDFKTLERARRRLIFGEFLLLQLALAKVRKEREDQVRLVHYSCSGALLDEFSGKLPFRLTGDQEKVMREILEDTKKERPMNRLLQGDVGSGKTVVAAFAVFCAVRSGFQAAVMAPTEILAEQHFRNFSSLLSPHKIRVSLLTGNCSRKTKQEIYSRTKSGETDLLVGTHALIQEGVEFPRLSLTVVDEQHKFGVMQRATLKGKGLNPDLLVMTATPIPRTLALTLYGDLDISYIIELPPGRKKVKSYWVSASLSDRAFQFVNRLIGEGKQAYVVCPLIEESDKIEARAAVKEAERLRKEVFPDRRVGLLHGRMKGREKEETMHSFRDGDLDVLISTTVIEVGVDVSNASVMVVLNADRFGLAQLHQLRGRVGRGNEQAFCIFVSDPSSDEGRQRMNAIVKHTDGFLLAEEDLRLRGPGEFYGTRQHGLPELRIGDPFLDIKVMEAARAEAEKLLSANPSMEGAEAGELRRKLDRKFRSSADLIH